MDSRKRRNLKYTRKWKAAKRVLKSAYSHDSQQIIHSHSDSDSDVPHFDVSSPTDTRDRNILLLQHSQENQYAEEPDASDVDIWNNIDNHIIESSDSEIEDIQREDISFRKEIIAWANTYQIKHNAIDSLLKLLRKNGHHELPASAKTLLKTVRDIMLDTKSDMQYTFFGVESEIVKNLDKYPQEIKDNIDFLDISLNVDGLPLFSSSSQTLWPILCSLHLQPLSIFPLALSFGKSKPSNLDFLSDTVEGLRNILLNGILFNDRLVNVRLKGVICDAPAKAMIKGIKLYSGYHGCDRCFQRGHWHGRMTYQEVKGIELRTDQSSRAQACPEHHNTVSPFCNLPLDMVQLFPVDYMHQACLGVMKRLILIWLRGKREVRMSALQCEQVSQRLLNLQRSIPGCFARKPRSLSEIDRWKATEYRQFLLYTGKLALKDILRQDLYEHFITLSTSISLLVCPRLARTHNAYAQNLLEYFVEQGRVLYGPEFLVYNVHSMVHIASNVTEFQSLDSCSAFPFENYLHQLKRMVRSGKNPLAQVVKRLSEWNIFDTIPQEKKYKISFKRPNNSYILRSLDCCEVVSVAKECENGNSELLCRVYERPESLFRQPCDSSIIGAYYVHARNAHMKILPESSLDRRAIQICDENGTKATFLAILHEF